MDEFDTIARFAADAMENMDEAERKKINTEMTSELVDFIAGEKSRRN